ncbi:predicted protein [Sclerotinia sclerotiorum 1980 UF-70]|uniref:Uncharacterized protein n=1 Tax=Sclerotinia sclerotiorum (strain ATCC 18683 / 1980 / Ss-1) TaxID=665079 RepID=A7EB60_SCLS1|nr:predicted protein [Sclerotinia sclerotiorum 1980 UF-70]EDN99688.1 predicted protein [Sclerotinia sclerotiorum 1980 UF-70]
MSYQEHQQENHKNGCYDASQDGEFVEHDDEPSQENRQRGNEDERNRGSNGRTINRKISDQWTRCKRKLTRNSTCSTTVEIWNLINKTSVDEARIHILYCPRPWCLRFVPLIGKSRLVGCNISNILPSNGHEVSEETQRHTTRAPSDTPLLRFFRVRKASETLHFLRMDIGA